MLFIVLPVLSVRPWPGDHTGCYRLFPLFSILFIIFCFCYFSGSTNWSKSWEANSWISAIFVFKNVDLWLTDDQRLLQFIFLMINIEYLLALYNE